VIVEEKYVEVTEEKEDHNCNSTISDGDASIKRSIFPREIT